MPTQVERMDEMMRFFGFVNPRFPDQVSANALAAFVGVTNPTAVRWQRGEIRTPDEVCDRLGINTAWIVGRSSRMWSEAFEETRREIRAKLARRDWSTVTRTARVAQALDMARATDFRLFTCELVSSVLRLDEKTIRAIGAGTTSVNDGTIKRLSEWLDVPIAWFKSGDPKTLRDVDWTHPIEKAIKSGLSAGDVERLIERFVKERRDVESLM
jgi:hypothetical protein